MTSEEIIKKFIAQIESYERGVLPDLIRSHNLSMAQFKATCINEIKKSPKMQQAFIQNPMTLFGSILFLAEIGLTPDETIGDAFLLPYLNNDTKKMEVKPIIGYLGVIKILYRSNLIDAIDSNCVYEGDTFEFELGLNPTLKHIPDYDKERNSKTFKFAYAIAHMKNGKPIFRVMNRKEIEAVKNMQKYNNGLFFNDKKDPNMWMLQKTVLKQLSKLLPKDFYGSLALRYDDAVEGGATLVIDEQNKVKLIEGSITKPTRFRDIYGTLGKVPVDMQMPE